MRIEAVCVCDGFGDFLRYTLPQMQIAFDRVLVVTSPTDRETPEVCERNRNPYLRVDSIQRDGRFEKGRAINAGLGVLEARDFVAVVDADIWLPPTLGRLIRSQVEPLLNPERFIFGTRRRIARGFPAFERLRGSIDAFDAGRFLGPEPVEGGVCRNGVPIPIGFFQMWHPRGSGIFRYCEGHTLTEIEDVLFSLQWIPRNRIVCELSTYHLQTEDHYDMEDWNGRRQPRFGPEMSDGRA